MTVRLAWALTLALMLGACGASGRRPPPSGPGRSTVGGDFATIHDLTNGVRVLASGTLPNGQRFRVATQRYAFHGRVYNDLEALLGSGASSFYPRQMPGPLAFSAAAQCSANPELLDLRRAADPRRERRLPHPGRHLPPSPGSGSRR